jgi:hypothetical protein
MSGPEWVQYSTAAIAGNPTLASFWEQLKPAYDFFESRHRLPDITVAPDGSYKLAGE